MAQPKPCQHVKAQLHHIMKVRPVLLDQNMASSARASVTNLVIRDAGNEGLLACTLKQDCYLSM